MYRHTTIENNNQTGWVSMHCLRLVNLCLCFSRIKRSGCTHFSPYARFECLFKMCTEQCIRARAHVLHARPPLFRIVRSIQFDIIFSHKIYSNEIWYVAHRPERTFIWYVRAKLTKLNNIDRTVNAQICDCDDNNVGDNFNLLSVKLL